MENHVTLINQLGSDGMVVNSVDRVVKTRVTFEVLNVFDRAGGKIVDHVDFVATLDVSVAQMRADKTRATCDKYSQTLLLICHKRQKSHKTDHKRDAVNISGFGAFLWLNSS